MAEVAICRNLSYTIVTGTLKYRAAQKANKLTTKAKNPAKKQKQVKDNQVQITIALKYLNRKIVLPPTISITIR